MTSALNQFEARLLQTEQKIRSNAPFADVFNVAAAAMREIPGVRGSAAWASSGEGVVRLAAEGACADDSPEFVNSLAATIVANPQASAFPARRVDEHGSGGVLVTPVTLTNEHLAALEVRTEADEAPDQLLREAAAAVTDCLADVFRNALLDDFQRRLKTADRLLTLCHRLHQCDDRESFAITLAHEARTLLNIDRASVLWRQDAHWALAASSGTDSVDSGNPICRALGAVANGIAESPVADQWIATDSSATNALAECSDDLRTLALNGTKWLRVVPIPTQNRVTRPAPGVSATSCLVLERFESNAPADDQAIRLVRDQVAHIDGRRFAERRSLLQRLGIGRVALTAAMLIGALLLVLVRTDFEIEVTGQLFPQDRYRVFSPHDGTIEELRVSNEAAVKAGESMIRVRNPDLDLQLQQTAGNLETERVRLTSVQRSRSVASAATGTLSLDQILGGEVAVKQRIADLEQRIALLTEQRDSLTVQARTDGVVYRANLQEELLSRPVRRGDFLFEVIPTGSAWHLELHIPDSVVGYVQAARMKNDPSLPVRFFLRMSPGVQHVTHLESLENTVEILDGRLICRGIAGIDTMDNLPLRPGTSVTARVYCGRRSLGFVIFRELIEFVREQSFAWF